MIHAHALAVGRGRGGGGVVLLVQFARLVGGDALTPENLSVTPIHRERDELSLFDCREKNTVAPDTRRGQTGGRLGFPKQVGARPEFDRRLVVLGHAGGVRPAELRPVEWRRGERSSICEEGERDQVKGFHRVQP